MKMMFEVTIISKEIIKPSSPTPDFLKKHHLSYIDQLISPPLYMPLIYFYSNPGDRVEISNRLKKSLSETLTRFYPLAGKLVDHLYVDCNDDGVEFFQAKADVELSEILADPVPDELNRFLPHDPNDLRDFCMAVQISFLSCGSMAVGLIISHKITDAISFCNFASTWAHITRTSFGIEVEPGLSVYPKFEGANLFPPREKTLVFDKSDDLVMFKEKPVSKIFHFPISKINALRDKYYTGNRRPTRIEALVAFIWSRLMATTQTKPNYSDKICSSIETIVNLRSRFDPPLSSDYFGNLWMITSAIIKIKDVKDDKDYEKESFHALDKMREALSNVNSDHVAKLRAGYSCNRTITNKVENEEELVRFGFTSLCRFPLYEVDFGWGKPVWVSSARWGICNVVSFVDSPLGNGIEAWVNLNKEVMAKFEQDKVLREFVSSNHV